MKAFCLLLALFTALPAHAGDTIQFAAEVQDDALAEEAILLVHCLSDHSHLPWEFSGSIHGAHWLKVHQKERRIVGTYKNGHQEKPVDLAVGGADEACTALEPAASVDTPKLGAGLSDGKLESSPALEPLDGADEGGPSHAKTWLWVGLGVAAAVGGFFLLRPHGPAHTGITMK